MSEQIFNTFGRLSLLGKLAVLGVVVAAVVLVWSAAGMAGSFFVASLHTAGVPDLNPQTADTYYARVDSNKDFINDRSPFFKPKRPEPEREQGDTPPPPPPPKQEYETYRGPQLMGLGGSFAYFESPVKDGEKEIKVGESGGVVEVKRIIPPFKAVVQWQGKEWELDLVKTRFSFSTVPADSGGSNPFDRSSRGRPNPFSTGGSSPNEEPLFLDVAEEEGAATGADQPSGGQVPSPASRRNPRDN